MGELAMSTNAAQINEIHELIRCVESQIAILEREREPVDEFDETERYYELSDKIAALREQWRALGERRRKLSEQQPLSGLLQINLGFCKCLRSRQVQPPWSEYV